MFRHILVPLDGSKAAEKAIPFAARMAHTARCTLVLVHVHSASFHNAECDELIIGEASTILEDPFAHTNRYLEIILKSYAQDLRGLHVEMDTEGGATASPITFVARMEQADIMVLCSHGVTGMAPWIVKSLSQHLIRRSPLPILVLNAKSCAPPLEETHFWRMIIPLDGSVLAESALKPTIQLASACGRGATSELHLLHVVPIREERQRNVSPLTRDVERVRGILTAEAYLKAVTLRLKGQYRESRGMLVTTSIISSSTVAGAIVRHVEQTHSLLEEKGADLIAMTTHERGEPLRVLKGNMTERILGKTSCPLLVILLPSSQRAETEKHRDEGQEWSTLRLCLPSE